MTRLTARCDTSWRPMPATMLIVDDHSGFRTMAMSIAKSAGYNVVGEAADGAEALSAVMAYRPDLLLLDIWMPILNGLEVLEHLGRAVQGVGLKVVVLSHQGDSDMRLEGFALGVVDYWTKDLSLAELSARIESVLGSPSPATESAVND